MRAQSCWTQGWSAAFSLVSLLHSLKNFDDVAFGLDFFLCAYFLGFQFSFEQFSEG
jgi:hypothetical protein